MCVCVCVCVKAGLCTALICLDVPDLYCCTTSVSTPPADPTHPPVQRTLDETSIFPHYILHLSKLFLRDFGRIYFFLGLLFVDITLFI